MKSFKQRLWFFTLALLIINQMPGCLNRTSDRKDSRSDFGSVTVDVFEHRQYDTYVEYPSPACPGMREIPCSYERISERFRLYGIPCRKNFIGFSNQGRAIEYLVVGDGEYRIFLVGSIHGNEPTGRVLIWKFLNSVSMNPGLLNGKKLIVIPNANPDGVCQNSRYNARGVDLNRNFDTPNRINNRRNGSNALSEPESRAIVSIITRYQPHRLISLHDPKGCIDYDGHARHLAEQLAQRCRLPVKKIGALPGSLGSYCGLVLKIPSITFEFRKDDRFLHHDQLWRQYESSIIGAIVLPAYGDVEIVSKDHLPADRYSGQHRSYHRELSKKDGLHQAQRIKLLPLKIECESMADQIRFK